MSVAVSAFLSKFPSAKATGGQHMVICPAHGDRNASLAVKEGRDGSVLLKCHGGCSVDSILAAMGLEQSALFEPKDERPERLKVKATYDYCDENGELLFQVVRYD